MQSICHPIIWRLYRAHTGLSIHAYRERLRLMASLASLVSPEERLVDLALDLGYSSHSHFTQAFRRAFGKAPGALRGSIRPPARVTRQPQADL